MIRILIRACLVGAPVRYNGSALTQHHPLLSQWQQEGRLVSVCPELLGGLKTPRPAAEIQHSSLDEQPLILTEQGHDVTQEFIHGAQVSLRTALDNNVQLAILTERSPSCGSHQVYDGNFTRQLREGMGTTARLLTEHGIKVFSQHQIDEAAIWLAARETSPH